ncbi:unnamed protein product, partial [Medioppia subpectinata]
MSKRRIDLNDGFTKKNRAGDHHSHHSADIDSLLKDAKSKASAGAAGPGAGAATTTAGINACTQLPFSQRYYELFRKRIQLPVWEYKEQFLELIDKNQIL